MTQPRLPLFIALTTCLVSLSLLFCFPSIAAADEPRIAAAYTAWDDYYFYAAFEVTDHNVISKNRTPASQPQEDDDVEVFFNTAPSSGSAVRTPNTYQMAVSAGSGAYFSVGDGTKIPKAKLVLTYKYAVTIDGTLNDPSDNDTGFTVELAIPWQELGLSGPPASGQIWGFNAISRNRENLDTPAQSFASLSPKVHGKDDIQDPSKWTKIQFISTLASQVSGPNEVYCPRVVSDTSFPVIDGVVRAGEWNTNFGYSFGDRLIAGDAPTREEEPNITDSPFATAEQPVIQTPQVAEMPTAPSAPATPDYTLSLPGGGEIHVGKLKAPPPQPYVPPTTTGGSGRHRYPVFPGSNTNPLAANLPPDTELSTGSGPEIDENASLALVEQRSVTPLIVSPYVYVYPTDLSLSSLLDQPIEGISPAFGGDRSQWHRQQLSDARRAGIDVLLPVIDPSNPQSAPGLAALVEAMKEMKADGEDYPLLGVKVKGDDALAAVKEFLTIVPDEFRAKIVLPDKEMNQSAYIVVADTLPDIEAIKSLVANDFDDSTTVLVTTPAGRDYLRIAKVSPGGWGADGSLTARSGTSTLTASWEKVFSSNPSWVYVDSWNDYEHGTEVAATRQYGEQYADLTRISALRWSGADEWDAKYLQNNAPTLIAQKTIYTVSVRIENNGSIPWRAGENYALCYRWYKDGRLYDDSAPRIPISSDIYPGQSTTVSIGVVAQNSAGTDIEPGRYTLVFDMVQGQSRWFSYVGSRPLRIPVRVEDTVDSPRAKAVVVSSTTPAILDSNGSYAVALSIRNEGQETWDASNATVTLAGNRVSSIGTFGGSVYPGAVGLAKLTIRVPSNQPVDRIGGLTWTIQTPGYKTTWVEHPFIVSSDTGASFSINNLPRTVKTDETNSAKIALFNIGPYLWKKAEWKVGYVWLYLDGTPAAPGDQFGPLDSDVPPGTETGVNLNFQAPRYPGKYQLMLEFIGPAGSNTLQQPETRGTALLPMIVTVLAGKDAAAQTLNLTRYYSTNGVGFETASDAGDFDGKGESLPGAFIPPDGTQELNVNPLLVGKPGPPEYPSGYYSANVGFGEQSNHRISFLYGPKNGSNTVTAKGQAIDIPFGKWSAVHLLAAAVGDDSAVPAKFVIGYQDGDVPVTLNITNWTRTPDPASGTVALKLPYALRQGTIAPGGAVYLSDYKIATDSGRHILHITLPTDTRIKILAITVER